MSLSGQTPVCQSTRQSVKQSSHTDVTPLKVVLPAAFCDYTHNHSHSTRPLVTLLLYSYTVGHTSLLVTTCFGRSRALQ
jgi:hypothetical protein